MMSDTDPSTLDVEREPSKRPSSMEEEEVSSSGYATESLGGVGRSDTLESVNKTDTLQQDSKNRDIFQDDDDDDDDLFKSARMEPEPEYRPSMNGFIGSAPIPEPDKEIPLDEEDDDEPPFKDAHLQPQLQLSGGNPVGGMSAASAVLGGQVINRDAIFGGGSPMRSQISVASNNFEVDDKKLMDGSEEFIDIKVIEPRKMGEGMSSFVVYKVLTKTNASYFKKNELVVIRRFSDFLGLHQKLTEKYLQNGRIIPPAPDKNVVGTTKIKMTKEGENPVQDEFVERRRAALERFINRTAAHPSLRADPDFREFLELDADLPKSSQTATLSGKNVMKLITKVGDSFSNMTLKMEETDEWFEEKSRTIEQLDEQLKKLHFSTEALADFRKNLAISAGNVSKSLAVLSGCEENSALSGAIAHLSDVQKNMEQIFNNQALADFYYLSELIKDYIGLVGAVKEAFQERVKAWQAWQSATANLTKKREAKVKAELQQKQERVIVLRQEIADLERHQDMAQENFDRISRLIKKEVEMFDLRKADDFKRAIIQYLEAMSKSQDDIAAQWERYLPELQHVSS